MFDDFCEVCGISDDIEELYYDNDGVLMCQYCMIEGE